ncbi:MAG: hypothetical protein L0I84_08185 [Halomonas subglaciescola]|nr:hypothetical protein [Halomonas subglaciescola]
MQECKIADDVDDRNNQHIYNDGVIGPHAGGRVHLLAHAGYAQQFGGDKRHPRLADASANTGKNARGSRRQRDAKKAFEQPVLLEGFGQLVVFGIDPGNRRIGGEVVNPKHADGDDERGAGMADVKPGNGKDHPGQRRNRAQNAYQPAG